MFTLLTVCIESTGQTSAESDNSFARMFQSSRSQLRIPDIDDAYGVSFRDIDGDLRPDIYLVCFRGLNRLLINRGPDQVFQDMTIPSGLGGNLMPMDTLNLELGTAVVDFDNDGDGDVVIAGWGRSTNLFRNDGHMTFESISDRLDLPSFIDANGCITADVNLDGHIDLFFTDEHFSNRLLLNNRDGSFRDITATSGLENYSVSQGAGFCDLDTDGDPDLFVANWFGPDLFYRNLGDGRFKHMALDIELCEDADSTNAVSFGDIDNDGDFDLFITHREGRNYLLQNDTAPGDSNWVFEEVRESAGLTDRAVSYGSVIEDFNNDGWLDIFVTNVGPNQLYENNGDGTFNKVFEEIVPREDAFSSYSTGAAAGDFDGDGDLDLFVANKDTFSLLYENPHEGAQAVRIRAVGVTSNRDAIGTRVLFYQAGYIDNPDYLLGARRISGGEGYLSMNEPIIHFGLDTLSTVDAVLYFPSGRVIRLSNINGDRRITVFEQTWIVRRILRSQRWLVRQIQSQVFWTSAFLVLIFLGMTYLLIRLGQRRYHWTTRTATSYLAGFFLLAFLVLLVMKQWDIRRTLISIDVLTMIFVLIFMITNERLTRMRRWKDRYREILMGLNHRIIEIHDDAELLETVTANIQKNTEWNWCCAWQYDSEKGKFAVGQCLGREIDYSSFHQQSGMQEWIEYLSSHPFLLRSDNQGYGALFNAMPAEVVFPIVRGNQFFGWLALGADNPPRISLEDLGLYQSITNQMAIALENNAYIRRSNEMIQKLTEAKVQKKYLDELEAKNQDLDEKNRKLKDLYDELKSTEAQLIHSEKMASLGQLVAGISHELNNPVGFIYSNIQQLQTYVDRIEEFLDSQKAKKSSSVSVEKLEPMLPDLQGLIDDTIRGSRMVKELVQSLRTFSHLDQAEWKRSDIHEGLETCLMILNPEIKGRVEVHKAFDAKGELDCNIGQLNQVFLNLLSNAAQAITGEGHIHIRTREEGNAIIVEIEDDGSGIPPSVKGKIFDPFFTTKEVGKGIGLGLSISYAIVQNHNGRLEVESEEGKGSRFTVIIPIRQK